MEQLSANIVQNEYEQYPERVIQFGTGNFLRAFLDWQVHVMNQHHLFRGRIVVVQSTKSGTVQTINQQDGLYTIYLQGIKENNPVSEHEVVKSISRGINITSEYEEYVALASNPDLRFIFSNTTEAGISFHRDDTLDKPQSSFPGKLTSFLYKRYQVFNGDKSKGFIIFPCELIEDNGAELKRIIVEYARLWKLDEAFISWLNEANTFCNTLVDRIVPGFPKDSIDKKITELGYKDELIVVGEQFHLFVIEGPEYIKEEFPAELVGLNVHVVNDLRPFRLKKVRLLNGAHTLMSPVAYLIGLNTVYEAVTTELSKNFIDHFLYKEIVPTLPYNEQEVLDFANDVMNRFKNPFIKHYLSSISLNSIAKFKTRVVPTLKDYLDKYETVPKGILFSLSALLLFYRGKREHEEIPLVDDEYVIKQFHNAWDKYENEKLPLEQVVTIILSDERLWGVDLSEINKLVDTVTVYLTRMIEKGVQEALILFLKGEVNESVY